MDPCMSPEALTEYLHRHIPLTAAMQLRVLHSGDGHIELLAPLSPNRNHRDTAFGGSLATLGIVTGWTLLQQGLLREGVEARVVVQKSECEFLEPVVAEFVSESHLPAAGGRVSSRLCRSAAAPALPSRARCAAPVTRWCVTAGPLSQLAEKKHESGLQILPALHQAAGNGRGGPAAAAAALSGQQLRLRALGQPGAGGGRGGRARGRGDPGAQPYVAAEDVRSDHRLPGEERSDPHPACCARWTRSWG